MPIYEFYSPDTNRIYSFFARGFSQAKKIPRCPDRPGARMERLLSKFAVTGRAKEKSAPAATDSRMERVMAEMERAIGGVDENNPDPRAIGRMMRAMAGATGQPMPSEMEQMVRRLEAGEDPEKLEEEFGDAFDAMDPGSQPDPGERAPRAKAHRPSRDPTLHEMADFV